MSGCSSGKGCGCGCCRCNERITPMSVANRAGLPALSYRVGTYATFFETMKGAIEGTAVPSLAALTTLESSDPSIAMLDAWAVTADVLTFYQERFANEGYLRTAMERRSILELGRLVGYELRPGVASSVYLAYTLDENAVADIPAGSRSQSIPSPGEKPQPFETSEPLHASWQWNALYPRLTRRQVIELPPVNLLSVFRISQVWLAGTAANLEPQDPLLFVFGNGELQQAVRVVKSVALDHENNRTEVVLQPLDDMALPFEEIVVTIKALVTDTEDRAYLDDILRTFYVRAAYVSRRELVSATKEIQDRFDSEDMLELIEARLGPFLNNLFTLGIVVAPPPPQVGQLVNALLKPPSLQPANSGRLSRSVAELMQPSTETRMQVLQAIFPKLSVQFTAAFGSTVFSPAPLPLQALYVLRTDASLFGGTAPKNVTFTGSNPPAMTVTEHSVVSRDADTRTLHLDQVYDTLTKGGWTVVRRWDGHAVAASIETADTVARSDYGLTTKVTRLQLARNWWEAPGNATQVATFSMLRETTVLVQSELLTLADTPVNDDVFGTEIELDVHCPGLVSGRWIAVTGERTDIDAPGVIATELVMLAGVKQSSEPGETPRTTLLLANAGLAYRYRRVTVIIRANVVKATHGETKEEILGNGDASIPMQTFPLRNSPLTWVSAPTPSGVATTLKARVSGVLWDETESLAGAEPTAHRFTTKTSDDAKTTLTFGNGREGSRVPSGSNNVTGTYRVGLGPEGNVKAGQITLIVTRPLGVKEVMNPLGASGGAGPETRDQARANVPVALQALDRLVSLRDYADFARTFAGVAKASAQKMPGGRRPLVHLTIAGDGDMHIDETSDLHRNLLEALQLYGDPFLPVRIVMRDRITVMMAARVKLDPHYLWETTEPAIRALLRDRFGFERRGLGQALFPSEVVAAIQSIAGVIGVDLDDLRGISQSEALPTEELDAGGERIRTIRAHLARMDRENPAEILPAQVAYITPDVADTVVLQEVK